MSGDPPPTAVNVLFVSYHFPPIGGSGAQRPARMVRFLPEFGVFPVVVTAPGASGERWTPRDATLSSDIPAATPIWRVPPEPPSSTGWRQRAERWLRIKDAWSRSWIEAAVETGIRAARDHDIDLIYVWMQPYQSAEVGQRLAAALGKPWVADLGDPWALDEMMIYPTAIHRRLERRVMRRRLATASSIVMSTNEAARLVRTELPELADRPVVAIPNGWDTRDFDVAPLPREDRRLRIVHTGYLHTDLGLRQRKTRALRALVGGGVRGVNILARSHVYLLQALERLRETRPDVADAVELHFAGVLSDADRAVLSRWPHVVVHGYIDHSRSIALMRSADFVFLPMHELPGGRAASVVPGKTYEYAASGAPILAAVPAGDARDLLRAINTAVICEPTDVEAIAEAIAARYDAVRRGDPDPSVERGVLAALEYRELARRLAGVLRAVADARPGGRPSNGVGDEELSVAAGGGTS
jgi:glycosyltransferase involved in cell wall biosynthesis